MKDEYNKPQLALIATSIIALCALVLTGFNPIVPVVQMIIEVAEGL